MAEDRRSFRVALLADELVNPPPGGVDGLTILAELGWGAIQLPASGYPAEVALPLLEQIAEQTEEFVRNRYDVVLVGEHGLLGDVLAAAGVPPLPALSPVSADEIRDFLGGRAAPKPLG